MHAFLKGGTSSKPAAKDKAGSSGETSKARERLVPWVEKYRPRCVDDVAFQEEVVAMLKKSLEGSDLPNMLFYGPPGTGKTSTILAAGRELFGDMFRSRVLELNASDERGIDVIRNKVKTFAQQTAGGTRPDGRPCPPFKIVILDEADSMTNAAQSALRRTMEKQSKNTRFCLICNYVSRIIEPLTSRCSKFRFKPLSEDVQRKRLLDICQKEGIKCGEEAMNTIISTSEGDLRKAITFLQSAYRLRADEDITVQDIYEIGGVVPNQVMTNLMITCSSGSYEKLEKTVLDLQKEGYAATQVVTQLFDLVVERGDLTDTQKSAIMERMAIIDKRLCDGADEYLQVMDIFTHMMGQICNI
ncbi:replication factor C subunit 4-like [Acanthaster planci]|uniref:Replication factor C subunit 2 n=1 Tax=Acanthaster planci TaxID=133434 RepID=A0A8B7YJH1_ACAPL|nr:replication factor C subunit 4-like [Acanthaster planci]XP_022093400.1 replication factor C subunit 4-like [Acanthaster planci]